jgi:hypothetical protein
MRTDLGTNTGKRRIGEPTMTDKNIHNLACAIILQAVRDYFHKEKYFTKEKTEKMFAKKRKAILKDLRSKRMDFLSGGLSVVVAEKLEKNPKEIRARLRRYDKRIKSEGEIAI